MIDRHEWKHTHTHTQAGKSTKPQKWNTLLGKKPLPFPSSALSLQGPSPKVAPRKLQLAFEYGLGQGTQRIKTAALDSSLQPSA